MSKLFLTRESVPYHRNCLENLSQETPRTFGTLDAHGMMCHLIFTMQMSLGEVEVEDKSKPILRNIVRKVAFEWVTTWPGGKIKAPIDVTPKPTHEFNEDRERLFGYFDLFLDALDERPDEKTINPGLGPTTIRYWSRIHGRHNSHHFRQFGIA
jgi:hypothetical protein